MRSVIDGVPALGSFETARVLEFPFAVASLESATDAIIAATKLPAQSRVGYPVRFTNAWCLVVASDDPTYRELLCNGGTNFPDGMPVATLMRARDHRARRVRGPSAFESVLDRGRNTGVRHLLIGGTEGSLRTLKAEVERRYPGVEIVGTFAPPFVTDVSSSLIASCLEAVESAEPNLVWIGMGSPKQDFVADALAARTGLCVVGVGAAFDFSAGIVKPAPPWMQRIGLEWAHRLMSDPRRLWRRYLIGNARFVWLVARDMLASTRRPHAGGLRRDQTDEI